MPSRTPGPERVVVRGGGGGCIATAPSRARAGGGAPRPAVRGMEPAETAAPSSLLGEMALPAWPRLLRAEKSSGKRGVAVM